MANSRRASPGDALGVGGPGAPAEMLGEGRAVGVVEEFELGLAVVEDFQEKHPAELGETLGVAIDTGVFAHDVLDGFDEVGDVGHEGTDGRWRAER